MAEFVQFRAEEWVNELEEMERIGLFQPKEIKSLVTKRKEFEYKIHRRSKCKEDYLKYIQFELDLNRIIKARRAKMRIKQKKKEIEHSLIVRVGKLFKFALLKFPDDIKLWMSFFKFCKGVQFHSLVSRMLVRMLQIHANKANLWVFAANWEYEQCNSISNARQFLTTGLRHHPTCAKLYEELFKLELKSIKQNQLKIKRKIAKNKDFEPDEVTKNIINGKVANVIYESAIKEIEGADFKVTMYNHSIKKNIPRVLSNKIFRDLVKNHLDEEITWAIIARREFYGKQCDLNQLTGEAEKIETDEENIGEDKKMKIEEEKSLGEEKIMNIDKEKNIEEENKMEIYIENDTKEGEKIEVVEDKNNEINAEDGILRCVKVFEIAIKKFNSVKMWSLYLDFMIKMSKKPQVVNNLNAELLSSAMQGAMASGKMEEKYYIEWITRLQKGKEKIVKLSEVLERGTQHHPNSLKLWYARLKFSLSCTSEDTVMEIFKEAIENLTDAVPLWNLVVKYLFSKSSHKVEEVLLDGIKRGGEVAQTLKPFYIEWLVQEKGIVEARSVFESSEMNLYPCLEFYKKMADLELKQTQPCLDKVRRCHDLACMNFGKDNPNVWLEYVRFELKKGDISKISKIHRIALKALDPEGADEFLVEFNKFKMDVSI